jgi:putative tryptophan/tyrosine transport system substrate-binding protein
MRRRDFIGALIGSAIPLPFASTAQVPSVPVIGYLDSQSADSELLAKFRQGLNEWGYFEGRNVEIEYRTASNQIKQLPALAVELVRSRVALIVAAGLASATAAKEATATIPILFVSGLDPIQEHLVTSFNRPGGNATGVRIYNKEIISKRLELLQELVTSKQAPEDEILAPSKIGYLINDDVTGVLEDQRAQIQGVRDTAKAFGLVIYSARSAPEIELAFASMSAHQIKALLVDSDPLFNRQRALIVALAARYGLPVGYRNREFVEAGGLMSYGPSLPESWRQIGQYAGRILKGARPEELPVQLQNKYELVINMKTANALGLSSTPLLRALADEVIE